MLLTLSPVILFLVQSASSVPCRLIGDGWYSPSTGTIALAADGDPPYVPPNLAPDAQEQLNPFKPGQGFEIVDITKTFMRFQNAERNPGGFPSKPSESDWKTGLRMARVIDASYASTSESLYETIKAWMSPSNDKTWLPGGLPAFEYSGILKAQSDFMVAQSDLFSRNVMVTFMLPSGVAKVERVNPSNQNEEDVKRFMGAGAFGLKGKVDPAVDYAYIDVFPLAHALTKVYKYATNPIKGLTQTPNLGFDLRYVAASDINGECVVIDLRNLPKYSTGDKVLEQPLCPIGENGKRRRWADENVLTSTFIA